MNRISLVAMTAVAGLFSTNVLAADLGGDCCADLEERVAELEATTARKGNRKVSLTVYGQVTTAVMYWDAEGPNVNESNVYVVDPQTSGTRFGFKGKASINSEWSAGYQIELQWQAADATRVSSFSDEGPDLPEFRQAHWYIESSRLGKIRVGQADTANSGIAEISVANELIADAMTSSQAGQVILKENGGPGSFGSNFEFNRQNIVRYDTPTYAGFVFSAAWGEDDIWDVALRYAGELGGFKIAAGIAYGENTDSSNGIGADRTIEQVNGSVSAMHMPTGLFATANAGQRDDPFRADEETFWHVNAGLERKYLALGKTTLFGMVGEFEDDDDSTAQYWGLGAVQKIDAAAMDLYISYRNYEVDNGAGLDSDFDVVIGGGRIQF
ncbi:MAG: porin [Alphaproteobacteria bacterium]|nr:porin [Alphaproteobacteria bacterium]